MYTPEMRESIAKVEASRARRMNERYPSLAPDERQDILKKFHPDFIADAMRPLRVGAN